MKETFRSPNETFNLPHSDCYCEKFDEFNVYVEKSIKSSSTKKSQNIIKSNPQILEIKNCEGTYYKKPKSNSNYDTEKYIDDIIKELLEEQKEYIDSLSKSEYQRIKDEFKKFTESLDKELKLVKEEMKGLCSELKISTTKPKKSKEEKIRTIIESQKKRILNGKKDYSDYKEKWSSWIF